MNAEESLARDIVTEIRAVTAAIGRPVRLMEVCGTHTVELRKQGIHSLLPPDIHLISGPGCPVCVTPSGYIDNALRLAADGRAVIVTFGDLMRVPGNGGRTLASLSATGRVRMVYSPNELSVIAGGTPLPVVFLAVGFETTIPAVLSAFREARRRKRNNVLLYTAFKTVPNALRFLLSDAGHGIDGFILPGHVSVVIGSEAYGFLEQEGGRPGVITGFDGLDMLVGILALVRLIRRGERRVVNAYPRAVTRAGNVRAQALISDTLEVRDDAWRGLGAVPGASMGLAPRWQDGDAEKRLSIPAAEDREPPGCLCAKVIAGKVTPPQCALFAKSCTPDNPVGPCMVSSEGTCAAYFRYGGAA